MNKAVKLGILASAVAVGGILAISSAQTRPSVTIVLNWVAEPPHGGYYAAVVDGLYAAKGVDVKLVPGGPNVAGYSLLGSGKVEFAQADPAGIMSARAEGNNLVGVFADLQLSPQVLMFHKSHPVKDFADLNGRKVAVTPGAPYWEFLKAKYKLDKVQQLNYSGQQAQFIADKTLVQQGYAVAEPFTIKKETGEEIDYLVVGDSGFNAPGMLTTTDAYLAKNPQIVKAVVEASQEGWKRYVANPSKYAAALKKDNKDLQDDFLEWSGKAVIPFVLGKDGDTKKFGIGYYDMAKIKTLHDALVQVKVLKAPQDWNKVFTNRFIPKP